MNDAKPIVPSQMDCADIPVVARLFCRLLNMDGEPTIAPDELSEVQWIGIVRWAVMNQLSSVLLAKLKHTQAWASLPESACANLTKRNLLDEATALLLLNQLDKVLSVFLQHEIPVIVLKGAFLAEIVYTNPCERRMGDIDLLVPKAMFEQAVDALRSIGYHSSLDHPAHENFSLHHHAPPFIRDGYPVIELHWDLIFADQRFPIDIDGVWQRAQPAIIAGVPVLGLSPEDLLLHLCIHTANHRLQGGLRASYDIALTLDRYADEMEWEILINRARQWQAERSIFLMLTLGQELFGGQVPSDVLARLQPDDFNSAVLSLAFRLVLFNAPGTGLPAHVVLLKTIPGIFGKLRILLGRFFPPVKDISLHFGVSRRSWQVWLYYPVRWLELFRIQFRWVWRMWQGDRLVLKQVLADKQRLEQEGRLDAWLTHCE